MRPNNRREFLSDVGRGMLAAGLGASLAGDLGFSPAFAAEGTDALNLGKFRPLVDLMQGTPAEKLLPLLVEKLKSGEVDTRMLISAGALANAETFGGQDYVGFHTAMAMLPALEMTSLLASERKALPVLKVLYRNCMQCQSLGGASKKVLAALHEEEHAQEANVGVAIRDVCRKMDVNQGEQLLASIKGSPVEMFNALQPAMQDDLNVHRFVFAHRTYGLVGLLGTEHAYTILRQCVRFCVDNEKNRTKHNQPESPIRTVLPKLLDQYKLAGKTPGKRDPGDAAVEALANTIYMGPNDRAADAVAAALADGISVEAIGEAISLASNLYVLRQPADKWRAHGDAAGVHSSDATNAFRNMARVSAPEFAISGLIVAAYHAGLQAQKAYDTPAYPTDEHRKLVKIDTAEGLLAECEDAVKHNDQGRAAAAIAIYGDRGYAADGVFNTLLKYAISEDGRLHGEKYFHTVREEYRTIRPAFRWREMISLARVTASAYGYNRDDKHGFRAAGYEDACKLLGVEV